MAAGGRGNWKLLLRKCGLVSIRSLNLQVFHSYLLSNTSF